MKRQKIDWRVSNSNLEGGLHLTIVQVPLHLSGYPQCDDIFKKGFASSNLKVACLERVIEVMAVELSPYLKVIDFYVKTVALMYPSESTISDISKPYLLITLERDIASTKPTIETDSNQNIVAALDRWLANQEASDHSTDSILVKCLNSLIDQNSLRQQLEKSGGVAFVPNGSILPLAKSNCNLLKASWSSLLNFLQAIEEKSALSESAYVPFSSPASLEKEFILPHQGAIRGMLIPQGVVVIAGGGYHGKSTLLTALKQGVFDHLPGHSCEFVLSLSRTHAIRSEEGRFVGGIDITPFISELPAFAQINPETFMTTHASGSTSMAANVLEALESDAQVLLLDEDTCATNFMIRDSRMRALVNHEPITPFIYRVNGLYRQHGVSTVVVVGGAGDWFDVQNCTLLMDNYQTLDRTDRANSISKSFCTGRVQYNGRGLVHQLAWSVDTIDGRVVRPRYLVLASVIDTLGITLTTENDNINTDNLSSSKISDTRHSTSTVRQIALRHGVISVKSSSDGRRLLIHRKDTSELEIDFGPLDQHVSSQASVLATGFALVFLLIHFSVLDNERSNNNNSSISSDISNHGLISIDSLSEAYDNLADSISFHSGTLCTDILRFCEGLTDVLNDSNGVSDRESESESSNDWKDENSYTILRRLCVLEHKRSFLFALHRLRGLQFISRD